MTYIFNDEIQFKANHTIDPTGRLRTANPYLYLSSHFAFDNRETSWSTRLSGGGTETYLSEKRWFN